MNRIQLKEFYKNCASIFSLVSAIFMLTISGLAIYIADFEDVDGIENSRAYILYCVFIFGAVIFLMSIISSVYGLLKESEGVLKIFKISGVISFVIGILNEGVLIKIFIETKDQWDTYAYSIFGISFVSALILMILNIMIVIFSVKGDFYIDGKKLSKDIPDKLTLNILKIKYKGINSISYSIIGASVFAMSYYFSQAILSYDCIYHGSNEIWANIFFVLFIAGEFFAIINIITGMLMGIKACDKVVIFSKISSLAEGVLLIIFLGCSLLNLDKEYVMFGYPDKSYMIFSLVLVVVSMLIFPYKKK